MVSTFSNELNNLSNKEREIVLKILNEYKDKGSSNTYNNIITTDYNEYPVDILTFIDSYDYLGKAWHSPDGKSKLYPYWREKLKEIFPDNVTTNYNHAIFSGARGLGKSEIAITCMLYMLYRVMCLKNPHDYFNLKPTEKIAFAFFLRMLELVNFKIQFNYLRGSWIEEL